MRQKDPDGCKLQVRLRNALQLKGLNSRNAPRMDPKERFLQRGPYRTRTDDNLGVNQVLYQLS